MPWLIYMEVSSIFYIAKSKDFLFCYSCTILMFNNLLVNERFLVNIMMIIVGTSVNVTPNTTPKIRHL